MRVIFVCIIRAIRLIRDIRDKALGLLFSDRSFPARPFLSALPAVFPLPAGPS
jgi:hypothetical protein